jgi:hypothetical protein
LQKSYENLKTPASRRSIISAEYFERAEQWPKEKETFSLSRGSWPLLEPHCFAYVLIVHFSELIYVFKKNSDARERHTNATHCQKHPKRPEKKNFLFLSRSECFGDE